MDNCSEISIVLRRQRVWIHSYCSFCWELEGNLRSKRKPKQARGGHVHVHNLISRAVMVESKVLPLPNIITIWADLLPHGKFPNACQSTHLTRAHTMHTDLHSRTPPVHACSANRGHGTPCSPSPAWISTEALACNPMLLYSLKSSGWHAALFEFIKF